jgi:hypothetical protein
MYFLGNTMGQKVIAPPRAVDPPLPLLIQEILKEIVTKGKESRFQKTNRDRFAKV